MHLTYNLIPVASPHLFPNASYILEDEPTRRFVVRDQFARCQLVEQGPVPALFSAQEALKVADSLRRIISDVKVAFLRVEAVLQ